MSTSDEEKFKRAKKELEGFYKDILKPVTEPITSAIGETHKTLESASTDIQGKISELRDSTRRSLRDEFSAVKKSMMIEEADPDTDAERTVGNVLHKLADVALELESSQKQILDSLQMPPSDEFAHTDDPQPTWQALLAIRKQIGEVGGQLEHMKPADLADRIVKDASNLMTLEDSPLQGVLRVQFSEQGKHLERLTSDLRDLRGRVDQLEKTLLDDPFRTKTEKQLTKIDELLVRVRYVLIVGVFVFAALVALLVHMLSRA